MDSTEKVQGSADVPAPILGQRTTSEPSAPSTELCYRVLERVCGAQVRKSTWVACACRQLPDLYWSLGPTLSLRDPSHTLPFQKERKKIQNMCVRAENVVIAVTLSNPPHGMGEDTG